MSKLPPLPHWCESGSPFAEQMQAYATAATEPLLQRIADLERQLEEARNQVLEEAAVECDKRAHAGDAGALMAARAIRALKGAKE